MTTEVLGLDDLVQSQSQPHVPINRTSRRLEVSIAGTAIVEVEADADIQIPTDDEPATWRYSTIRIVDSSSPPTLSGAVDVIFPDLSSLDPAIDATPRFELQNDTAETLTIKGSSTGSTGVQVPSGESRLVRWDGTDIVAVASSSSGSGSGSVVLQVACSDLTTALTTGTSKGYLRAPQGFTITDVRASLLTASSSGAVTVDINVNGLTILSTKLTVDQSEKTSESAATPPVVSDSSVSDDDEITIDIDNAGTGAKGLIVTLIGSTS